MQFCATGSVKKDSHQLTLSMLRGHLGNKLINEMKEFLQEQAQLDGSGWLFQLNIRMCVQCHQQALISIDVMQN